MSTQTRRFISAVLLVFAIAAPCFCLDYDQRSFYRLNGQLFFHPPGHLVMTGSSQPIDVTPPVITLREQVDPRDPHFPLAVSMTGFYPRAGMGFNGALIGGLVLPIIALIAACWLTLSDIGAAWRYFWHNLAA